MAQVHRKRARALRAAEAESLQLVPVDIRLERLLAAALALICLMTYILTLFPTVPGGDSGELIAAGYTLGVVHPPGYPLFTLLAKVFTLLPFGSIAWRVNLLSALCDSAAAVFLFYAVSRWSRSAWAALAAGGLFAFSPLIWSYAVQAEVFGLNNLFVAALLWLTVSWVTTQDVKFVRWGAFVLGLGLTNHHTLAFLGIPLVAWILWTGPAQIRTQREFRNLAGLFCAPLLLYLYLPLTRLWSPPVNWGDFSTVQGFFTHLLRREYGTFQLASGAEKSELLSGIALYFSRLPSEFAYVGLPLALIGLFAARKVSGNRQGFVKATVTAFLGYLLVFHYLSNLSIDNPIYLGIYLRFWQLPNILFAFWIGLGIAWLGSRMTRRWVLPLVSIAVVLVQLAVHFHSQNQSDNRLTWKFGKVALDALPPGALFLTQGDVYTNSIRYLQLCENRRTDVVALDRNLLTFPWSYEQVSRRFPQVTFPARSYRYQGGTPDTYLLGDLIARNKDRFSIFISNLDPKEDRSWESVYSSWPWGTANWVVTDKATFSVQSFLRATDKILRDMDLSALPSGPLNSWESYIRFEFHEADYRRAKRLAGYSLSFNPPDLTLLQRSLKMYLEVAGRHPEPSPALYRNIGIAYSHLLATDSNARSEMIRFWRKYLEVLKDPASDPQIDEIRRTVDSR